MKVAIDTNVLAYAEGVDDRGRQQTAILTIERLGVARIVLPAQVLGELQSVLGRRGRMTRAASCERVRIWRETCLVAGTSTAAFDAALDLTQRHDLQIWDAVILAVSVEAGCRLLLSEDMQEGFSWAGLTIANPFADILHPLLRQAFQSV